MKTIALLLAAVLAAPVQAIELSLEENRAERGNIGYIDMTRLFRQFPETLRAKENFEEILRQTEDQVNLRKVEILKLRNEVSQLRMEREVMSKAIPMQIRENTKAAEKAAEKPKQAPAAQTPAQNDLAALKASEQAAPAQGSQDVSQLPGLGGAPKTDGPAASDSPAAPDSLVINIPGVSTAPVVVQAPEPEPVAAGVQPAAPEAAATSASPILAELDAKLAARSKDLEGRDAEFKRYQAEQEKNLLELESRKTEVLLGKIHRAVQEVARREGVSVVVDKNSILYGHDAVDLTEKVLKFLKGI